MMKTTFACAVSALSVAAMVQTADAAVVGSLDGSRAYTVTTTSGELREQNLNGNYYSALRNHLTGTGSTVKSGATQVTAEYLADVDLFITGTPTANANTAGRATAAEQDALRNWVASGGIAFILGETTALQDAANSWLSTFDLSISGNYGAGSGRWTGSENPLLDGVNEGASNAIALNAGGAFAEVGPYDILARYGSSATKGQVGIVGMQYGAGYVIATGDSSPFSNERFASLLLDGTTPSKSATFINNIVAMADAQPAPVPLPAAGWLLIAGMGAFGVLRRRQRA